MGPLGTISVIVLVFLGSLVTQILAADHLPIPPRAACSSTQFQCRNGGCIQLEDVCDCYNHCGDGSDQENCTDMLTVPVAHKRGMYAHYCPDGKCIPYFAICSGYDNCDDMSDEKNCSKVAPCNKLQFECANGKCLDPTDQCDGYSQCGDGSDEMNCFGKCKYFECNNGKCIRDDQLCDCKDDCGDGTDENNCSGKIFHCPNGTCLLNSTVCNCENDCGDGADEKNCDGRTFHCPNGNCLLSSQICNCQDDCVDGEDEENCENGCQNSNEEDFRFSCKNITNYLMKKYLNDGFDDCGDGSDENYCSADSFICNIDGCLKNNLVCDNDYGCTNRTDGGSCTGSCQEFQCPNGGPCIHNRRVCDCNDDCGDGADEKNCRGSYMKPFKYGEQLEGWEAHVYHCRNGKCISDGDTYNLVECNGDNHCGDYSDEMECEGNCRGFQCPSGRCLPSLTWLCDGIDDCGDWTDENNCPDVPCRDNEFRCRSGQCIHENFADCDMISKHAWCRDASDRENCEWRDDLRCGEGFTTKHYRPATCNPMGNYPCCSDQGWCGNTADHCDCPDCIDYRVCTGNTTYQTNDGKSICTCVNGKYECKEKGCIYGSAIILDDGCNYCICSSNGTYEYCTDRTCINEMSTEGYSTLQVTGCLEDEGFFQAPNSKQCMKAFLEPDDEGFWEDADRTCKAAGLVLARPTDPVSLRTLLVDKYGGQSYWIGARGDGQQMRWQNNNEILDMSSPFWQPGIDEDYVTTDSCLGISANAYLMGEYPDEPYWSWECAGRFTKSPLCEKEVGEDP